MKEMNCNCNWKIAANYKEEILGIPLIDIVVIHVNKNN
jgi:predicted small metal-binding protein